MATSLCLWLSLCPYVPLCAGAITGGHHPDCAQRNRQPVGGDRPGRYESRVGKHRPKPYPLMRVSRQPAREWLAKVA